MPKVRAVQKDNGTLSLIAPVDYETECNRVMESNPELAGRPFLDTDSDSLPSETYSCKVEGCGEEHPSFEKWRLVDGKVVLDETAPDADFIVEYHKGKGL